ncbi:velvet factor [Cunninghamella echinulata]|nr:velvet factor [Cunninghamella echinulata]
MTYSINNLCNYRQGTYHHYKLKVLQQPIKARLCSFKEKVDRRPIDPPPIVQLCCTCQHKQCIQNILHSPYFFLYATLTGINDDTDLYLHHGHRTTAGAVVQSLHRLKYNDNKDGGFFVFADISVRLEGRYRLKFTLFEIVG